MMRRSRAQAPTRPTPGANADGLDAGGDLEYQPADPALKELASKARGDTRRIAERIERAQPATAASFKSAHAAVAAAILPPSAMDKVSIRPMPIKPSLFEPAPLEVAEQPVPKTFIPPAPDRTVVRTPRMPRIDELPLPAQNEIRAQRGELGDDHPEKRRMSLMQRLASVGIGRRGEEAQPPPARVRRADASTSAGGWPIRPRQPG